MGPMDINGSWSGSLTFTEINMDAAAEKKASDEGCDLAILEALRGKELPMTLDLVADKEGKGKGTFVIDASSLDTGSDNGSSTTSEPTTLPLVYEQGLITFDFGDQCSGGTSLTTPVSFSYNPALGTPRTTDQQGNGNYSAVWLNSGISGLSNNVSLGTLFVTIPMNAASSSAYAVHFDHASASPNGLASFPNQKLTGLITLSKRTSSSWGDAIPDSWRLRYFLTLNNWLSATNADADGDGVNNLQEYLAGTDPTDPTSFFKNIGTDQGAAQQTQDCVISWPSAIGKQYVIQRSPS